MTAADAIWKVSHMLSLDGKGCGPFTTLVCDANRIRVFDTGSGYVFEAWDGRAGDSSVIRCQQIGSSAAALIVGTPWASSDRSDPLRTA